MASMMTAGIVKKAKQGEHGKAKLNINKNIGILNDIENNTQATIEWE